MFRIRLRPCCHFLKRLSQGGNRGAEIEIRAVKDFEAGFPPRGIGLAFGFAGHRRAEWIHEHCALGVGVQIEFDLADFQRFQLFSERSVAVVDGIPGAFGKSFDDGADFGRRREVIGIVGADELHAVHRWVFFRAGKADAQREDRHVER